MAADRGRGKPGVRHHRRWQRRVRPARARGGPGGHQHLNEAGFVALAVCIGVAILEYRLYEIDRIISRTLSYAIVTGLLVGVYAGLVLLATRVLAVKSPVHQTLEPAHVSVWISGAAPRTGPGADGADGAGRMPT